MVEEAKTGTFMEKYGTALAVVVGAVIIGGALIYGHAGTPSGTTGNGQPTAVDIKDVKTDNDPYIGDKNAPVTIAVWFDYQCPFCKQLDTTTLPQIYADYVKTGKVRVVFKDFQFLGEDSMTAAEFARAVWEAYPDKFYDWYKAMFNAQDAEGDQGFGDLASIQTLTKTIDGMDVDRITKLMTDKKAQYDAAIAADRTEGTSFGINGTPAMIIGTQVLSGAQPYSAVQPLIDAELK
jgi:protein-disulfide isomerase